MEQRLNMNLEETFSWRDLKKFKTTILKILMLDLPLTSSLTTHQKNSRNCWDINQTMTEWRNIPPQEALINFKQVLLIGELKEKSPQLKIKLNAVLVGLSQQ
jgi:hypothetical protein